MMKVSFKLLLWLCAGLLAQAALAQDSGVVGCQGGVCAGPSWDPNWNNTRGAQQPQQVPSPPQQKWEDRWGALVLGGHSDDATIATAASDMASKTAAEALAMQKCKSKGGGETCQVDFTYYNQCVAAAWGNPKGAVYATDSDIPKAKNRALKACSQKYKGCEILYSACSMPVLVPQ